MKSFISTVILQSEQVSAEPHCSGGVIQRLNRELPERWLWWKNDFNEKWGEFLIHCLLPDIQIKTHLTAIPQTKFLQAHWVTHFSAGGTAPESVTCIASSVPTVWVRKRADLLCRYWLYFPSSLKKNNVLFVTDFCLRSPHWFYHANLHGGKKNSQKWV